MLGIQARKTGATLAFLMTVGSAYTGAQILPHFPSTEVHADRTVTFLYRDVAATTVLFYLEGTAKPTPMTKNDAGIWTVTAGPLAPEIYRYHFEVDGLPRLDPSNPRISNSLINPASMITVSGATPELWEQTRVPHGTIHHHSYTTATVLGLPNDQSDYYVYTPPGYDPKSRDLYPVLYLLHGWTDSALGWLHNGRVDAIFDNLLAEGKIKPMIVVMPLAYGDMAFIHSTTDVWSEPASIDHNASLATRALLTEVIPQVESAYNVSRSREDHAIAGLSMGGLESLTIGLAHTDRFAWVGGFSSAVQKLDFDRQVGALDPQAANLRLLWIACGTEDGLMGPNRRFVAWLKSKNMPVTAVETPGLHTWLVWRDNISHFAPLLFKPH